SLEIAAMVRDVPLANEAVTWTPLEPFPMTTTFLFSKLKLSCQAAVCISSPWKSFKPLMSGHFQLLGGGCRSVRMVHPKASRGPASTYLTIPPPLISTSPESVIVSPVTAFFTVKCHRNSCWSHLALITWWFNLTYFKRSYL